MKYLIDTEGEREIDFLTHRVCVIKEVEEFLEEKYYKNSQDWDWIDYPVLGVDQNKIVSHFQGYTGSGTKITLNEMRKLFLDRLGVIGVRERLMPVGKFNEELL